MRWRKGPLKGEIGRCGWRSKAFRKIKWDGGDEFENMLSNSAIVTATPSKSGSGIHNSMDHRFLVVRIVTCWDSRSSTIPNTMNVGACDNLS